MRKETINSEKTPPVAEEPTQEVKNSIAAAMKRQADHMNQSQRALQIDMNPTTRMLQCLENRIAILTSDPKLNLNALSTLMHGYNAIREGQLRLRQMDLEERRFAKDGENYYPGPVSGSFGGF